MNDDEDNCYAAFLAGRESRLEKQVIATNVGND
jgi:hypothetical protein